MTNYERKVFYHETDQMGVVHHSNYIKWMEEARVDLMDKIGYSYKKMEELGIISPVVSVSCEYKSPAKFNDVVYIKLHVEKYTGVKLEFSYEIRNKADDTLLVTGYSKHCFLKNNKVISLKNELPDFHNAFLKEAGM